MLSPSLSNVDARMIFCHQIKNPPVWWEIETDIWLPPLSDTMEIMNTMGEPLKRGDTTRGAITTRRQPDGLLQERHYRRSDLESVGPFDIALPFEPFGHRDGPEGKRSIGRVVSQRFYRAARDAGLTANRVA